MYQSHMITSFNDYEDDAQQAMHQIDQYQARTNASKTQVVASIEAATEKVIKHINELKSELVEDAIDHLNQQIADYEASKKEIEVTFEKIRGRVKYALEKPEIVKDINSELDIAQASLSIPPEKVVSLSEPCEDVSKSHIGVIISIPVEPSKVHSSTHLPLKKLLRSHGKHSEVRLPAKSSLKAITTSACTTATTSPEFRDSSTPRLRSPTSNSNITQFSSVDGNVNDNQPVDKLLGSAIQAWLEICDGGEQSANVSQATEVAQSVQTAASGDSNNNTSLASEQPTFGGDSPDMQSDLTVRKDIELSEASDAPAVHINFSSLSLNSPLPPIHQYISSSCKGGLHATLSQSIGPPTLELSFPIGACLYEGGVVICNSGDGRVLHVTSTSSSSHVVVELNARFSRPSAVVADESTRLLYVKDDKCIRSFGPDMHVIRQFPTSKQPLYGLVLQKDQLITMCGCGNGRGVPKHPTLVKYNLIGDLTSLTPLSLPLVTHTKLRFMDIYGDNLYISDLGASCVYWASLTTGRLIQVIASPGKQPGFFNEPSGIACDSRGNLLIADSKSNRIQVFDGVDRKFKGLLDCGREMIRPSSICLAEDSKLLAVSYLGPSVNIYHLAV